MLSLEESDWNIVNGKVRWGSFDKPLQGADPETFEPINKIWARDHKRLFVYGSLVRGAEAMSFRAFNILFGKDRLHCYYSFGTIKDAEPESFRALDDGIRPSPYEEPSSEGFASDAHHVFHYALTVGKPSKLKNADPQTFESINGAYGRDVNRVYYRHSLVPKADPSKFRLIGFRYATDGSRVYYGNRLVRNADAETFQEEPDSNLPQARDKHRAYERWNPLTSH